MHRHNLNHDHHHDHHDHHHDDHDHHHTHSPDDHDRPEPTRQRGLRIGNTRRYRIPAAVTLLVVLLWMSFYTVRETEFVLITQFGQPLYSTADAGLHPKWFYQTASYFDRRLRLYNPRPSEFLTRDKKNLVVETYGLWRIQDPRRFVETVGDDPAAEMRLHDIIWSGLSAALGSHDLDSIISTEASARQAGSLMDNLAQATDRAALSGYGIRVVDVRVKRLNLPEQNKQSVYARMRAERERIARQYRAEGEEQALRIRADADRQREEIVSAAYRDAERVKGEGDAESTRIYGQAYSKNPRFYKLVRTLESYKKVLDDKTTAILSSDSELLRILMRGDSGAK